MRLQREANAAASILVHGSLPIHFLQLQRAWRAIFHGVVQSAVQEPIVTYGVRFAILQIDQRHRSRACYVSRDRIRVVGALWRWLKVVVIDSDPAIVIHGYAGSSYAQIVVGGERIAVSRILV